MIDLLAGLYPEPRSWWDLFLTVNIRDGVSTLLKNAVGILPDAVRVARAVYPFHIDDWVVLLEHMHCIWTLPPEDDDYVLRWRAIKAGFSRALPGVGVKTSSLERRRERSICQRRYREHTIRGEQDYAAHMDYTHFNPVNTWVGGGCGGLAVFVVQAVC